MMDTGTKRQEVTFLCVIGGYHGNASSFNGFSHYGRTTMSDTVGGSPLCKGSNLGISRVDKTCSINLFFSVSNIVCFITL